MAGILTDAEALAQQKHAEDQYLTVVTGQVKTDIDAKVALANATHTAKTNAQLATGLNHTTVALPAINADVYTGANVVTPVNATWMEAQVRTALDADLLHHKGGGYTSNYVPLSPYLDPLWLIEGAKLTGEKFY